MTNKPRNGLDDFTNGLALILGLDDDKALKLVDLIEDRVKALADERLDMEFGRGAWRRD
jgi:hypothetical protein